MSRYRARVGGSARYQSIHPPCGLLRGWPSLRAAVADEGGRPVVEFEAYEPGADGTCACDAVLESPPVPP